MATTSATTPSNRRLAGGLIALSIVPMLAGIVRLVQLASGATVTNENRRFFDSPSPVVLHIVGAIVFSVAGAFQFVPALRRRGHRWHRRAGSVLAPAGIVVALSGLWMTYSYDLPASDNSLLSVFRYAAGLGMLGSLVAALLSLRAKRYRTHGAWMARAYALGLGAGTQVITHGLWMIGLGKPTPQERAWLMFAGWFINIAVVEYRFVTKQKTGRVTPVRSVLQSATEPAPVALVARPGKVFLEEDQVLAKRDRE